MKVFLTGGTGFVGAHSARALLEAGHELRLLVRNAEAARQYFARHGHEIETVIGDIREQDKIAGGMQGCDAVLHAAAMVALDPNRAQETYDNNVLGMKAVIGTACERGLKHIVYVSSLSALFWPDKPKLDESTPLANSTEPYSRSKRDSDEYVRGLQAQGYPVQITYPAAVVGPDDPKFSESNYAISQFVSGNLPLTTSGFQAVDVRDLAQAHRYLLEHPPTANFEQSRYIIGGHYYPWPQMRATLEQVTGRKVLALPSPPAMMRAIGSGIDLVKKVIPFSTHLSAEAMAFVTQWSPGDSSRYLQHSGLSFRPGAETLGDTVRWLKQAGHIKTKHAGKLATA